MRIVVTGGAGFIGGHLVELLLDAGHRVTVLDALRAHYDVRDRRRLMTQLAANPSCDWRAMDLAKDPLDGCLDGADVVVHLAARPGVGESWGDAFADYALDNLVATHRLLRAVAAAGVPRLVVASSSSVYGTRSASDLAQQVPGPQHPYGVSKFAVEQLCRAHAALGSQLKIVLLRYFTIYGPRQRPDMAVSRFIAAAEANDPIELRGAGDQTRRFTYVRDAADATLKACTVELTGVETFDVAADQAIAVATLAKMVAQATNRPVQVRHAAPDAGEPQEVAADLEWTRRGLDWWPTTTLEEGLSAQVEWSRNGGHAGRPEGAGRRAAAPRSR
jgi:nucleoside-diphosphate-sugar epimerase